MEEIAERAAGTEVAESRVGMTEAAKVARGMTEEVETESETKEVPVSG